MISHGLWQGQCQLIFEVSQRLAQGLGHVRAVSDRQEFSDHGVGRVVASGSGAVLQRDTRW
ncbi:hypothetical protein A0U94_14485 (plasmid) [Gluconobacter albidus]|nr:hypothetical protein A0U94_14485 [Gluconobacter albidus]OUI80258.1 hypothetical protein HK22_06800 [Gluconobacter sp. DsW_056]